MLLGISVWWWLISTLLLAGKPDEEQIGRWCRAIATAGGLLDKLTQRSAFNKNE